MSRSRSCGGGCSAKLGVTGCSDGRWLRTLCATVLRWGLIRDFRLSGKRDEANTLDLKLNGVTPFIDVARILALGNHVSATGTAARLEGATQAGGLDRTDAAAWIDGYDYIRMLRMRLNEEQAQAGGRLTNRIDPARLNDLDRSILRESLREARRLQARLRAEYQL
jgi:CBS domain-containing protein